MPTIDIPGKICSHCGGTKYYHRIYSKVSKVTGKQYECYECKNCNIKSSKKWALNNKNRLDEIKKKSYLKYRNTESRKEKNRKIAKKYRDSVKHTLEYKERVKRYSIKSFQILKNSLSDRYIKDKLIYESNQKVLDRKDVPQELIELKRKQLLLIRQIKNKNNGKS
jgi:hypothetical protein